MIGERFTREARQAVVAAVGEAERTGARQVEPEHLALALLGAPALAGFDLPRDEVAAEFADIRRRGGLTGADVEALRGLGIDVDEVLGAAERSLGGAGAATGTKRKWRLFGNHLPFAPESKQALNRSLTEALDLGSSTLTADHLVLALLGARGPVSEVLGARGARYVEVRKLVAAPRT
ncbi:MULTISPECIES: Clp protease N-terminal domain-containing protein [Actinosynnema]|uniref:Clp protease N-terminal domain-containing protein n=1 Tax=Actinosynnema TaxID=40566 RepID=UPI0020A2B580|nr:Clp protease N-terminal domain-containing protein [Actinosynnema pretiosum]MCP2093813.1 Clp amino terminal domain-containing protein, pathogenicity island component [Actinosynnema pretiosum]